MRLLTFHTPTGLRLGVSTSNGVIDVAALTEQLRSHQVTDTIPTNMEELFAQGSSVLPVLQELLDTRAQLPENNRSWLLAEKDLQLGPSVPHHTKIICVGLNYRRHAAESGMPEPSSPVLFPKYSNALAGAGEEVPLPKNAEKYDYEAELALVIGRQARYISEGEALEYVFGYSSANDLSARDLQFRTNQWMLGKTLDKFLPIGPYLVTADEVPDPQNLSIQCHLNGEQRQNSNTADMIFPVAYIVSYLSQYMTLEPGDVIVTGTPEGVISGMKDPVWMKSGDEVTVEIGGLGKLTNVLR